MRGKGKEESSIKSYFIRPYDFGDILQKFNNTIKGIFTHKCRPPPV